jgi:NADH-quinone oxidoreductase subunit C
MSDDTTTPEGSQEGSEITEDAPRDERREELLGLLDTALDGALVESHVEAGRDMWVRVATDAWSEAALVLRDRLDARYFCFLSAIDWLPSPFGRSMDSAVDNALAGAGEPTTGGQVAALEHGVTGGDTRFQVFARVAHIGDPGDYWGVTVKADVPDDSLRIGTWTRSYAGADWHERESWEMFGIEFEGHPGLRNMYLPTGFEGHPLRKDFPLVARMVKPWPGIVDVEPMPGGGGEGDGEGEGS